MLQIDNNIKETSGNIKVQESNVQNLTDKLNQIKESVRIYAKYSVYLQAVSRDGIPAQILKKKLPIVNYRINTILSNIVNFKIDMFVKNNGDVQEIFYFNPVRNWNRVSVFVDPNKLNFSRNYDLLLSRIDVVSSCFNVNCSRAVSYFLDICIDLN